MPHLLINMCIGIKITCDNQGVRVILLNATFNKISVISWGKPEYLEKTSNLLQVTEKTLSHNVVSSTPHHEQGSNSQY